MDIHQILLSFSYVGIFALMVSNGILNFPSSQILYLVAGYFVGTGSLLFIPTLIAGAIGNTIGNTITFLLIKKYDHALAHKILMMKEETFRSVHTALHETFTRRGMWLVFFGKLTPSVKAFIPVIAGLAQTKTFHTIIIFFCASFIWATGLIYLGKTFGEHVSLSSFLAVSLIVGLLILYIVYRNVAKRIKI